MIVAQFAIWIFLVITAAFLALMLPDPSQAEIDATEEIFAKFEEGDPKACTKLTGAGIALIVLMYSLWMLAGILLKHWVDLV